MLYVILLKYNNIIKMCDTAGAINGYYTPTDMANAQTYARMRIMYESALNYPTKLLWVDTNPDGSSNYNCPDPEKLKCKDGKVLIATEKECSSISNPSTDTSKEGADKGYYLEWRSTDPTSGNGQCYRGNAKFRNECKSGNFFDGAPVQGLEYDTYSGRCFITPDYCKNIGDLGYIPPGDNIPDYIRSKNYGGACDLSGGQKFADFIFGETVSRGIFGGKCFK
jgi:hypothetical protein